MRALLGGVPLSNPCDGYVTDGDGRFDFSVPTPEQFAFHIEELRRVGVHVLGRRLYATMRDWDEHAERRPTLKPGQPLTLEVRLPLRQTRPRDTSLSGNKGDVTVAATLDEAVAAFGRERSVSVVHVG